MRTGLSAEIDKAIVARWDAQSLESIFSGGLWSFRAPLEASMPYVVFFPVSDVPDIWTSDREIREATYQFSIWMKQTASQDPNEDLGSLMDSLKSAFDFAPITITGQNVHLMERQSESRDVEEDEIWHGIITYRVRRGITADYSPA